MDIRLKFDGQGLVIGKDLVDVYITFLLSEILTSLRLSLLRPKMSIENNDLVKARD